MRQIGGSPFYLSQLMMIQSTRSTLILKSYRGLWSYYISKYRDGSDKGLHIISQLSPTVVVPSTTYAIPRNLRIQLEFDI